LSDVKSFKVIVNEVNSPPVLTVPPDQRTDELSTLLLVTGFDDPDLPENRPTFSLVSPPAGMTINPDSGLIIWTPTEAQGPGIYHITVHVTDNGSPPLSDTKTFLIFVKDLNGQPFPIAFTSFSITNQEFHLRVTAEPGTTYSLQASSDLRSWSTLTSLTATGADVEFVDGNAASFTYRFFRVVAGP